MCKDLVPRDAVFLFLLQTPSQEIKSLRRKIFPLDVQRLFLDVADQHHLCIGSPWGVAVEQFVENESESPDVAFAGVRLTFEDLEGHV